MREKRKGRTRALLIGLLLPAAGCASALPPHRVATAGKRLASETVYNRGISEEEQALGNEEEERALSNETLPLEAVVAYAWEHNREIRVARERWEAATQVPPQVSAYDDPTIAWTEWNTPRNLDISRAETTIFGITQKIPFPGKLSLKGTIAEREADIVHEALQAKVQDVLARVKAAYYDIYLAWQTLAIHEEDKRFVDQFAEIALSKYRLGEVSQSDVLRAQVEQARLVNLITIQKLKIETANARLNALLHRPPEAPLGGPMGPVSFTLPYTLDDLLTMATMVRPELKAGELAIARDGQKLNLAYKQYYPDFQLRFDRFIRFRQSDDFGLMASLTFPLAFKSKYDAGVEQARADLRASQEDYQATKDQVFFQIKDALVEVETQRELVLLLRDTHIPQAEQSLEASTAGYQTGTVDFLSLIDSLRVLEDFRLALFQAMADFEKRWAELERVVGRKLSRLRVSPISP